VSAVPAPVAYVVASPSTYAYAYAYSAAPVGWAPALAPAAPRGRALAAPAAAAEPGALLADRPEALEAVRAVVRDRVRRLASQGQDEVAIIVAAIADATQTYAEKAGVEVASLDDPAREPDRATIRHLIEEAAAEVTTSGEGSSTTAVPQATVPQPTVPQATTPGAGSTAVWVVPTTPVVNASTYAVVPVVPSRPWWWHPWKR
jgi:hypothetical protein